MQSECDLRLQCEGGMAACKHQLESIIGKGVIHLELILRQGNGDRRRVVLKPGTAQAVNGASFGNGGQSGAWVAWNAVDIPAFQRID